MGEEVKRLVEIVRMIVRSELNMIVNFDDEELRYTWNKKIETAIKCYNKDFGDDGR